MAKRNQLTTSDHLEYSEYLRLLDCLHADKQYLYEMFARLAFCTALRISDVLMIRWSDIIGKQGYTVTEKKTGKTRFIPFNSSVRIKFGQLYHALGCPEKENYIFKSAWTGRPITCQRINQMLKECQRKYKLKVENISSHTFRKTFGRYVYELNNRSAESLVILNKILNHTTMEVTKRYIGITKAEVNRVFDSIQF